jgi:CubicO group peptidase (beta-lactamase class C family)
MHKLIIILLALTMAGYGQDYKKLDNWLEDNVSDMGGRAVLMIYKDGKIIYSNEVNDMSRRDKRKVKIIARRTDKKANTEDFTTTSRQPIASCSKWLSAALVMTLVDEGKLSLTDTVGKYLPVMSKNGKGNITISQCLSHTTGIKTPPLKEDMSEFKNANGMDEVIANIAALPMEGEPGKVFHYSNAGLQIAGAVIEKISGKKFETLFAERIARPLGMKNTDYGKGKVPLPAGSALSTPEDYINFLMMILNKGMFNGKRIVSESGIAEMQVNRITPDVKIAYTPAEAGGTGYGYGEWVMDSTKVGSLSKTVSSPGLFGSFPWVDNEKQYCAFLMTYYVKNDGRGERYKELKGVVDSTLK